MPPAQRRVSPLSSALPKTRADRGHSKIAPAIQEAILAAKRANPRRSIRQILRLLEAAGTVPSRSLSRLAIHRLLHQHGLSQLAGSGYLPEAKRSFSAEFASSIWYGDVMHGARVPVKGALRKRPEWPCSNGSKAGIACIDATRPLAAVLSPINF